MPTYSTPDIRTDDDAASDSVQDRLLSAATAEFLVHGYQGASLTPMTERAKCNVRMIYHYFGNKDGLYRACLTRAYDHLREAEAAADFWTLPPAEAMAHLVWFTFDYMIAHPEFQGMMRIENMVGGENVRDLFTVNRRAGNLFDRIDDVLDRGCEQGLFNTRPDPGELYLSILGLTTIHVVNRYTMGVVMGQDLASPDFLSRRRDQVTEMVLAWLQGPRT